MKKNIIFTALISLFALVALTAAACGTGSQPTAGSPVQGKVIKSAPVGNNLTATLSSESGALKNGEQEVYLAFTDASGKAVDVGAASLNFFMPAMGSMAAMNDPAKLTTTATPGVYRGNVNIEMRGEWQAQISYEGAAGKGKTSFPLTAQ